MDPVVLTVMYYVLFSPFFINGQQIELSFNTSVYEDTNDYYAHIGEDVVLTCTVKSPGARVNMYRGSYMSATYQRLVVNGELVRYLANQPEKYSFQSNNGKYQLTIHNLEKSDSSPYRCGFCTSRPFRCHGPVVVQLEVKDTFDDSHIPDFCDLINNTNGIFFTGNDLILRCPKLSLSLEVSNGTFAFSVDFKMEDDGGIFTLLTVKNLTPKFNDTMLSCFTSQNGNKDKDYCRYFPTILVFFEIAIVLSSGEHAISNGSDVAFTCHSHPFLPLTIQWDILDSNVKFENLFISDIDQGSKITFGALQFRDFSSSRLTVVCNVTIGSENSFRMASIYPRMQVVSSTQTTSLLSEVSSTQITASETMSAPGSDVPSFSPVIIVVPVIAVISILAIIALGIVYIKLRKPVSSNEADRQNSNIYQDAVRVEENVYKTMNLDKTELGSTNHDSEVADNVAYASYDEGFKRG